MSPSTDRAAKDVFLAALERPVAERREFVAAACSGDAGLEERVRELLDAHRGAERILGGGVLAATPPPGEPTPATGSAPAAPAVPAPLSLRIGDRIGDCVVTEVLGEGGFGVVLLAEQERPVRRRVAIKVLKSGLDSERVVRRFETEVQALGIMDHPNIARVYDAGTMSSGRRYFVMEYVEGLPITDYCTRAELGLRERLELVRQIALALQHAHQKGVVHRDIKPSNVLVAEIDGVPVPKVIDFGVAKATGSLRMPRHLALTAEGLLVGTPTYMSPEQISGEEDVDTRTDVYALGVLLYELLCGVPPFETDALRFLELQRLVCDVDPPPPSKRGRRLRRASRVNGDRGEGAGTASLFHVPPELDWVVLRCLEKDRARRYPTANELADELARVLADEPVAAAPPSAWYRARKLVRRHRAASIAVVAVSLAITAGLCAASWGLLRARESEAEARRERENVLRLSAFQVLEDLRAEAERLWPPDPAKIPAMERWLERAGALVAGLDEALPGADGEPRGLGHRAQLAALRARALPQDPAELEAARRRHPRWPELEAARARLDWRRRVADVRAGRREVERVVLDPAALPQEPRRLGALAWELVDPDRERFGREAEGLALAELALEDAEQPDLPILTDTLAWALWANGLDDYALAMAEETLAISPPDSASWALETRTRMRAELGGSTDEERIAELEARVAELEGIVSERREWTFADDQDRWWHTRLTELVAALEALADEQTGLIAGVDPELGWGVARRLAFAREVEECSLSGPEARERWAAAIASIADTNACPAYGGLVLEPQLGLLPLGRDPESGLHEFAHLLTGEPARRAEDGSLVRRPETGVVLVLVPGGRFTMGAQASDPSGLHYDPRAQPNEAPVNEVELAPYFLSKYELTQGQWERFTGANPSTYQGEPVGGVPQGPLDPVESLTAAEAERVLARMDLRLPTEAQWERAARAETDTAWWTGDDPRELAGTINLLDSAAAAAGIPWKPIEAWLDDGHAVHAPVGSYRPNPFGLYDVSGNVSELCGERLVDYWVPAAPGDGARGAGGVERVARGGSFNLTAEYARSALRSSIRAGGTSSGMGVRPARPFRSAAAEHAGGGS